MINNDELNVSKDDNKNVNKTEGAEKNKTKNTIKKVFNIIEYVFIILIILANATLIIKSASNPKKSPSLFGKKAFIIISESMIPTINIGDIVVLNENQESKVQDIIGFRNSLSSEVIVHRIIDEKQIDGETMYQTKGDNNEVADLDLVKQNEIEGTYNFKIPFIGKIIMFLYRNLAIIIIVLVLIMIVKFFI